MEDRSLGATTNRPLLNRPLSKRHVSCVQASFKPYGITIAVAKDRAIESLMQVGDTFVLNCLEENNYSKLMKHFLKRFPPGGQPAPVHPAGLC